MLWLSFVAIVVSRTARHLVHLLQVKMDLVTKVDAVKNQNGAQLDQLLTKMNGLQRFLEVLARSVASSGGRVSAQRNGRSEGKQSARGDHESKTASDQEQRSATEAEEAAQAAAALAERQQAAKAAADARAAQQRREVRFVTMHCHRSHSLKNDDFE